MKTYKLFDDQLDFKNKIKKKLLINRRIIGCAPTGFGKTVVFTDFTNDAISKGTTVLIITESRKIYEQIEAQFKDYLIIARGEKHEFIKIGGVNIAMAQTLVRRNNLIEQFKQLGSNLLVLIDEAHIGTTATVAKKLINEDCFMVGFTATPDGRTCKHLIDIYQDIAVGIQPFDLINLGRLTQYYHLEKRTVDLKGLRKKGGEFTEESQQVAFGGKKVFAGFINDFKKLKFRKCMIYTSSIKSCEEHADELIGAGFKVVTIHSKNPNAEQDLALFEDLESGIDICISVDMVTKGYDFPEMDLGIIRRATTSLPLFFQMVGRLARVAKGKEKFLIIDYGENATRHGAWNRFVDWQNLWRDIKEEKDGAENISGIRFCEECGYAMEQRIKTCPSCGFIKEEKMIEEVNGVLVDVLQKMNSLKGKRLSELTAQELAYFAKFTGKYQLCNRVASSHPDKLEEYRKVMGYNFNWKKYQTIGRPFKDIYV